MIALHNNIAMGLFQTGEVFTRLGATFTEPVASLPHTGHLDGGEAAEESADTGSYDLTGELGDLVLTYGYVRSSLNSYLSEEYLNSSPLVGGTGGFHFLQSEVLGADDCIDLVVTYQASPIISPGAIIRFWMVNRYYSHIWNGYDVSSVEVDESDEIVYITEDSEVYHVTSACSHLTLMIRETRYSQVGEERNGDGRSYRACELCARGQPPIIVYVAREGDCYHYDRYCSGLKRVYYSVRKSAVADTHRPCSRCG